MHYSEALKFKNDDAGIHTNLAIALARKGQIDEAVKHFTEAVRLSPDELEYRNNLRLALTRQKMTLQKKNR
jgi:Flp pilus assembly protein TadD